MSQELLILFVVILLAFILCSFLGTKENMENLTNTSSSVIYYGPNGATATITNGTITVTDPNGTTSTYSTSSADTNTYVGPNGGTAKVTTTINGPSSIIITAPNGTTTTFFKSKSGNIYSNTNYDNYNHYTGNYYPTMFYGPDGGTAKIVETGDGNTLVITYKNGNTDIYYIDDNGNVNNVNITKYYGPNGASAKIITDNNGKKAVEVTTPSGNKVLYYSDNVYNNQSIDVDTFTGPAVTTVSGPYDNTAVVSSDYYNSLPRGIPKSQIPPGDEDLYILKSQVVPPVCPRCPEPIVQCPDKFDSTKCPPCPPCARCPEPAFECQKVPNYKAFNPDYMPIPVLNDFSSFGM